MIALSWFHWKLIKNFYKLKLHQSTSLHPYSFCLFSYYHRWLPVLLSKASTFTYILNASPTHLFEDTVEVIALLVSWNIGLSISVIIVFISMLPNSGSAVHHSKANTWKTSVGWQRKGCFIQEACNLERRRTCVPEPTPKILLGHESF